MSELPLVSVIIPMRNEQDWIQRCLGSVLAQDYPPDRMEVLVADGMSTDRSPQMLAALSASSGKHWAIFPALGWGIGLGAHALVVYFSTSGGFEALVQRERQRLASQQDAW